MTTCPPRLSTAAMTRSAPTASASAFAKSRSGRPSLKSDDPAMICCAPAASTSCGALDGADAAADAARQRAGDLAHEREVVADAHRGVEIDDLHLGKALEPPHPAEHVVVPDREPLALNELHDGAVLEIDGGNQHGAV